MTQLQRFTEYSVWLTKPSITMISDMMDIADLGARTWQDLASAREWMRGVPAKAGIFVGMDRRTGKRILEMLDKASDSMTPYKARVAKTTESAIKSAVGGIS